MTEKTSPGTGKKKEARSEDLGGAAGFMDMGSMMNDWASAIGGSSKGSKESIPLDFNILLTSHRRNIDTIRAAQQTASELVQNLATLSTHYIRASFDDIGIQARSFMAEPRTQAPAIKASLDRAITHCRQVTDLFTESTSKVFDVYRKRFDEGMEEAREATRAGMGSV